MHINVDRARCQNHGQCAIAAPDVFEIDDNGELIYKATATDELLDEVEEAADVCPVQAILLED